LCHRDDDLALRVPGVLVAQRFGRLRQRVDPIDMPRELARFSQLGDLLQHAERSVCCYSRRPETLDVRSTAFAAARLPSTADAEAAYDTLLRKGIAPARIIIWGHSLGSAPAVQLAARHPEAPALVLFGAFTSIPNMAAEIYPYLPVRWVVSIRMDSLSRIRLVHIPVVIAHSVRDAVVPFGQGLRLYQAANDPSDSSPWIRPVPMSGSVLM
jgi:dienelactone hydrolase